MPITQVTHINHSAAANGPPVVPEELLAVLAHAEQREAPVYFEANPKLIEQNAAAVQEEVGRGCRGLDAEGRLSQAAQWKAGSNALIAKDRPHAALIGYLVGVWYLRSGEPSFPLCLAYSIAAAREKEAVFSTKTLDEAASSLTGTTSDQAEEELEVVAALRTSLLLNAVLAALKLAMWPLARVAATRVLSVDEGNVKALFRLAMAHEGEGDLSAALTALASLLKREPQNADARRLHETLRARIAEDKEKFRNMFSGGGTGDREG